MTVDELISTAHQNAANKGFWPELETWQGGDEVVFQQHINLPRRLMLVFTEIAEAWAASGISTEGHWIGDAQEMTKPEGYKSELADILIRMADICGGYLAAGFKPSDWVPLNPSKGSIEALIQRMDEVDEPLPKEMGLIIAQACEYDRKGRNALSVLYHGLSYAVYTNTDLHNDIRKKMRYNATRPIKHGANY